MRPSATVYTRSTCPPWACSLGPFSDSGGECCLGTTPLGGAQVVGAYGRDAKDLHETGGTFVVS